MATLGGSYSCLALGVMYHCCLCTVQTLTAFYLLAQCMQRVLGKEGKVCEECAETKKSCMRNIFSGKAVHFTRV